MTPTITTPPAATITDKTPLTLEVAATVAFSDGSKTGPALRRMIAAGKLGAERIGGRLYTTLGDINQMREKCRVNPKAPALSSTTGECGLRDGETNCGTGCYEPDREGAERKLAAYILSKHDPERAIRKGDANQARIADILSLEMKRIATSDRPDAKKRELINALCRIGNWFGNRTVGDLNGELQERYAVERVYQAAAWRDLVFC